MSENREPATPTVKIEIKGGIATVVHKDAGVRLIIVDKDGKQVGEGKSTETYEGYTQIGKPTKGKKYTRFINLTPQIG